VVYQAGELPGGELARSTGHWNTPAQLEVFQPLSGRVLMLTAYRTETGHAELRYQVCAEGDLAAVPLGAWHLTLVLSGPAAVFNLYTDLPGISQQHTSRHAASCQEVKYGSGEPVEITAVRAGDGFAVTGSPAGLRTWGTAKRAPGAPLLRETIGPGGLPAFCATAGPDGLSRLGEQALAHLQRSRRARRAGQA
jgi:hypothetical protein